MRDIGVNGGGDVARRGTGGYCRGHRQKGEAVVDRDNSGGGGGSDGSGGGGSDGSGGGGDGGIVLLVLLSCAERTGGTEKKLSRCRGTEERRGRSRRRCIRLYTRE